MKTNESPFGEVIYAYTRPQQKHIAEQFEFSFVRQLTGSAKQFLAA